jgi:nucleoside-diphosphate-sugar epimerase
VIATGLREGTDAELRRVNCDAPAELVAWLRTAGVRKLVLLSSGAVYGNAGATKQHPGLTAVPATAYGRSKLDGELAVSGIWPAHTLSIVRLYFPYGPGQKQPRLVPRILELVRGGQPIVCRPDGGPMLSLTHVKDICDVLIRDFVLADRPGVFNLAGPDAISIESLARGLGNALGIEPVLDRRGLAVDCVSEVYDRPLGWHSVSLTEFTRD